METTETHPNLLGQILISFNLVSSEDLDRCMELQGKGSRPRLLGDILMQEKLIDEKTLKSILSVQRRTIDLGEVRESESVGQLRKRLKDAPLKEYFLAARELGASDLHFSPGIPPSIRLNGALISLPADPPTESECLKRIGEILAPERLQALQEAKTLEVALHLPEAGRFRVSVFQHQNGTALVARVILDTVRSFKELNLPPVVREFAELDHGLLLVTGPAGSGKSSTLASIVNLLNHTKRLHIITIEDPIEVIFKSDQALISQREVPRHSRSFPMALRAALREDPDVIVVGELRDPETVATAITAAETGHLIFGTMHTHNAEQTVMRILDLYPAEKRPHIRVLLANVLRAVISQQLVPNGDGKGRSLAAEVMVVTPAIATMIREERAWQISSVMQMGGREGMMLMDDALEALVRDRKIAVEEAAMRAADRRRFLRMRR